MWQKGVTSNTLEVFEEISKLECLKDFHLCGGTGISIQLNHRLSEDLDFEILSYRGPLKELDSASVISELKCKFANIKVEYKGANGNQFECTIKEHVKLSFFCPQLKVPCLHEVPVLNNLKTVSLQDALGMKLYTITQRNKFRDYYDIYSLLKAGCSLKEGIDYALKFSRHELETRDITSKLLTYKEFYEKNNEGFFNSQELHLKYNVTEKDICDYIQCHLKEIKVNKQRNDTTAGKSIGRLFYETIAKREETLLVAVLDKLPEFNNKKTDEEKVNFLRTLLTSVGINITPYDFCNIELLEIRKGKDVNSLGRINEILAEYNKFNALNAEITQQQNAINEAQNIPMDGSLKELLIANCNSKIETLKSQQVDLRFFQEFEIAEKKRHEIKVLEMSKDISNKIDKALDSEIGTIKDKLESLHEDQEESNTKSVRRRR